MTRRLSLVDIFSRSAVLFKDGALQTAATLAAGLVPVALLMSLSYLATGLTSQAALDAAIREGEWFRSWPVLAAGCAQRLADMLIFLALALAIEARRAGRPLTVRQSYQLALRRFVPFVLTLARAALMILGGCLLLVVPGVILAVRYSLAHLAVIVEDLSGAAALTRSRGLVASQPRQAVGFLGAATIVGLLLSMAAAAAVSVATGLARALGSETPSAVDWQAQRLLTQWLAGLAGAWLTGFSLLLYDQLIEGSVPRHGGVDALGPGVDAA